MEYIKQIMNRVNNANLPITERYPELNDRTKIKITYVSPILNKQGLFRMIFPAIELAKTPDYSTIITNIIPNDCDKIIDDYNIKIKDEVVKWSDYMVFSANGEIMKPLIQNIKKLNPDVKIVLDVDSIYPLLNKNNYRTSKFSNAKLYNLEQNCIDCDICIFPDKLTEEYYVNACGNKIKSFITPNLISEIIFEGIDFSAPRSEKRDGKLTVLLMCDSDDWDDIYYFKDTLSEMIYKVPNLNIVVMGNCINFNNKTPLKLSKYFKASYTSMIDYYSIAHQVNADFAIVPIKRHGHYRTYYKLLELSALGYPIISMEDYPYSHFLANKKDILLTGQRGKLINCVQELVADEDKRKQLKDSAHSLIMNNYTYKNLDMLKAFYNVFE